MTAVLGIHDGHLATAALVRDGKLVACASEERFSRLKNQPGYPHSAIDFVLGCGGISPLELDLVVLSGYDLAPIYSAETEDEQTLKGVYRAISPLRHAWGAMEYHLPFLQSVGSAGYRIYSSVGFRLTRKQRLRVLLNHLKIAPGKVRILEHHFCHAYAAVFGPGWKGKDYLVLTLDGEGDEICATVNAVRDGKVERLAETPKKASIGWIYAEVTRYLGMKPLEHEYKVMGLAPYAQPEGVDKTYRIMRRMIKLNKSSPLVFDAPVRTNLTYQYLRHNVANHRFDWVAGATQQLTEDLILKWVSEAVKETGIHSISLSGGVFMNVKANLRVLEMSEVDELFVFPSCGDESNCIGAAWWGYYELTNGSMPEPLSNLYLGPNFSDHEVEATISSTGLQVERHDDIERVVAELLSEGNVVARMTGRMEWGARALGNRSILADPSDWETVRVINNMIKQRDFWMPFAPSILYEHADEYIENSKQMMAPYMIMAFNSTSEGKRKLRAAMHPYDFTLRPQIVERSWNQGYYDLIERFRGLTGIGGVLNTSFNLHGEPVVCNAEDAIHVLTSSGLEYLAIGNFLVRKKPLDS